MSIVVTPQINWEENSLYELNIGEDFIKPLYASGLKDSLNIIPVEWIDEIVSMALESEPVPIKKNTKSKKSKASNKQSNKNQDKQTH